MANPTSDDTRAVAHKYLAASVRADSEILATLDALVTARKDIRDALDGLSAPVRADFVARATDLREAAARAADAFEAAVRATGAALEGVYRG